MATPKRRLLDDIESQNHKNLTLCLFARLINTMSDEDRLDVLEALTDIRITGNAIHRALAQRKYRVSSTTIVRHRSGSCACVSI